MPVADVLYDFFGCLVTGTVSNFGGSKKLSGDGLLDFEAETKYEIIVQCHPETLCWALGQDDFYVYNGLR